MFFKALLFFGFLGFVIWVLFFKKTAKVQNQEANSADSMVECKKCKTFILQNEAIFSNGSYFCSKECFIGEGK